MAVARHYKQLISWQLADAMRIEVFKLTSKPAFARDFKRKGQIDDAIDSVCRNIAEGFGCGSHAEFARHLEISRRSLNEVTDAVRSAILRGHISAAEGEPALKLAHRLYPALSRFIAYLRRTPNRTDHRQKPRTDDR